ncbi:glycoside hydrolase family 99-like domain-containing protein [Dyadobacter sp. CY356]|uniref:glycoside hydrolase family 99-like domain-containing protein n=1 Tax=Dyadobacter sp. CY356 TaxID=2906442 RepID=UPI001F19E82C|nr:glycoside hydrolase family 99-like domain-containing protein [Dyadobacter sp. CY356]MCF0055158.1 glycoside hydrolase family 99-like domain-containing protein [Dyadobacter sp. CY356]
MLLRRNPNTYSKKNTTVFRTLIFVILGLPFFSQTFAQSPKIQVGAYYFDGWTGKTPHITSRLTDSLLDRKPIWGWVTSTPEIINKQIEVAYDAGITFFDFCWYFQKNPKSGEIDDIPLNNALKLYLKSQNKRKIKFSLLIANHKGFLFDKTDWIDLCKYWCKKFKDPSYLLVDEKPLITFFQVQSLVDCFGSSEEVNRAFQVFRDIAKAEGLKGISFAACADPSKKAIGLAEDCGFDIITGYNYHENGFGRSKKEIVPIDSMNYRQVQVWDWQRQISHHPVIPSITSNWDRRGWDKGPVTYSQRFTGYSKNSIKNAVVACKEWVLKNQSSYAQKIMVIYAWNEYGEGAWLTPSVILKDSLLQGVKEGLK